MVKERFDRRYFGAVLFVDSVTKNSVRQSFNIHAKGMRFMINRSYLHVICDVDGLEDHTHSFDSPPAQPFLLSKIFDVTITDPLQKYLPRIKRIELPRNPHPNSDDSIFKPIKVSMFCAPSGNLNPNWSVVRASVSVLGANGDDPEQPLKGSLLRIIREEDGKLIASGLSDDRGEALIIVPGIPFHNFVTDTEEPDDDNEFDHDNWMASGDVVEKETAVRLEIVVDKTLPWPVNPEVLEENRNGWLCKIKDNKDSTLMDFVNLKLKTGQTQIITLFVKIPEGM